MRDFDLLLRIFDDMLRVIKCVAYSTIFRIKQKKMHHNYLCFVNYCYLCWLILE